MRRMMRSLSPLARTLRCPVKLASVFQKAERGCQLPYILAFSPERDGALHFDLHKVAKLWTYW